jgi:tRNA pseudouridine13 synthase
VADVPNELQPRLDAREIDVTGPIFGPRMRRPQGRAAEREAAVLTAAGLEIDAFRAGGRDALGTRRPSRVFLHQVEIAADAEDLLLSFTLPRGAYATVVLEQILR